MPKAGPCFLLLASVGVAFALLPDAARADTRPHGGLFRDPDVSTTQIAFVYGGKLWLVDRAGGVAAPLAAPDGEPSSPRFSPDGSRVAFVADYDGGDDIYVLPTKGGVVHRVTWHPGEEMLDDWLADGSLLFTARGREGLFRQTRLYRVSPEGGLPVALPVPYGSHGAIDAESRRLAYDPHGAEPPSWKRYRGGRAADVWLFDLETKGSQRLTDWEGTDARPMWHGGLVYYTSDQGEAHRLNLWVADPAKGTHRPLTRYADSDVRWPAMGPGPGGGGEIVFQKGDGLHLLDLATETVRAVDVRIPGERPALRPHAVDVSGDIHGWQPSPKAHRVVVEARGDLWTLPAEKGPPRDLTRTSGVAEREPAWSPDGRWIAYFSDESGAYELWIRAADGKPVTRPLTADGKAWRFHPTWSPDSERIAFTDKAAGLFVTTVETATTVEVDHDPIVEEDGIQAMAWSPDSRWLAYVRAPDGRDHRSLFLYDTATGSHQPATSGMFEEDAPAFDPEGKFLYVVSRRHFAPIYADVDDTFVYTNSDVLLALPLRRDVAAPGLPKSDEVEIDGDEEKDRTSRGAKDGEGPADGISGTWKGEAEGSPILGVDHIPFTLVLHREEDESLTGTLTTPQGDATVQDGRFDSSTGALVLALRDEDGLTWRIRAAVKGNEVKGTATLSSLGLDLDFTATWTAPPGNGKAEGKSAGRGEGKRPERVDIDLEGLEARAVLLPVAPGEITGLAVAADGALIYGRRSPRGDREPGKICRFDPGADEPKEETITAGSSRFALAADGRHVVVVRDGGKATIHRTAAGAKGDAVPTRGMRAWIDPREEWRQMIDDTWRILGDYFYDPGMHGIDWDAVHGRARAMVADAVVHSDVDHVIREMIGELNVGHANYFPPGGRRRHRGGGGGEGGGVGLLGCDFALEQGAYRIVHIVHGAPWDVDARGPLDKPGIDVSEGAFLLAVNGVPVDPARSPWAALDGTAGNPTWITVGTTPSLADETRDVLIEPLRSEMSLRYREWVEANRRRVAKLSDGKVGYIHVPNTGWDGQNELWRQFVGQHEKSALIVDERWNGGGQIPTRFIELLSRPLRNYWARRDGRDWESAWFAHHGPKCMLINGDAGSGGDAFPWYFRQSRLGPLVGMRTWGGSSA